MLGYPQKNVYFLVFFTIAILASSLGVDSSVIKARSSIDDNENVSKGIDALNKPYWYKKNTFKCPSLFGAFSDKEDCSRFYVCVAGIASHMRCPAFRQFDKYRRQCLPLLVAVCDKEKDDKKTTTAEVTKKEKKFLCPNLSGSFPHPDDCTKYYKCTFFIPALKTCPDKQLFDGVEKECRPENEVNCGTRTKPTSETTAATSPMLPNSTRPKPTTIELTTPEQTTTVVTTAKPKTNEPTTDRPTTTEPKSPETTTTELTTPEATTGPPKPTGPPETDCDEEDLDCIITETGEIPEWFECPVDVGSYRHPVSRKLFIFCLNWKPYVKKCGQDLIYSQELNTCVPPSSNLT